MDLLRVPLAVVLLSSAIACSGPQPAPAPAPASEPAGEASKPDDKTAFAILKLDPALDAIISPSRCWPSTRPRPMLAKNPSGAANTSGQ